MPDRRGAGPSASARLLRRAAERYLTVGDGTSTRHSFSYGAHYDPENIGFGALIAINTETIAPGAGYDEHRHLDVEIVTWVLDGALAHRDSTGAGGVIRPGTAQRLSAGAGAEHAERNASATEPLRFVQTMLRSRHEAEPEYDSCEVPAGPGRHEGVAVHAEARLEIVRPRELVEVPVAHRVLVHVTRGTVDIDGDVLETGDELRSEEPGGRLRMAGDGEALVWHLA